MTDHLLPADIERASFAMIQSELSRRGIVPAEEQAPVLLRVIHATADFDYAETLRFLPGAVAAGVKALQDGCGIVTDTNMALAGISQPALARLGGSARCFMADPLIIQTAREKQTTRAASAMEYAAAHFPGTILAIGNAPTALLKISELIEGGLRPPLVIAVPVGFVNITESKERVLDVCQKYQVPAIAALGRKGGSSVAVAICNALLYMATGQLDPESRGWQ